MSNTSLEILFWIAFVYDLLWIPIIIYHSVLYWKHRSDPFIKTRFPKVTIYLLIVTISIILQRLFVAMAALKYINDVWEISIPWTYVQYCPVYALLVFKLNKLYN